MLVRYGGTFDPVHLGHLAIAQAAHRRLDARIWLMPAGDPAHRAPPGATAAQRAAMVTLAVAGQPGLGIDRSELQRGGASYSIDTVRALRARHGSDVPIALLVGADSFLALDTWKDWRTLLDLVHFVIAERPDAALDALEAPDPSTSGLARALAGRWTDAAEDLRSSPAGRLLRLRQPLDATSATGVRQRIANCGDWQRDVPQAVAGYIQRHGLYGLAPSKRGSGSGR